MNKNSKNLYGIDHINNISSSLNLVYDIVSKTYGPCGSNVLIERNYYVPLITKDGATVIDHISVNNENSLVVNLLKNITKKTVKDTGDGTTTTAILTKSIYDSMNSNELTEKYKKRDIIKNFSKIKDLLIKTIRSMSIEIKTGQDLKNIISISCNGDDYMTNMLLMSMEIEDLSKPLDSKLLSEKEINIKLSNTGKEFIDIINGSRYDCGYYNSVFTNNANRDKCEYKNPLVLLSGEKICNMKQLNLFLGASLQKNRPLIIFTPDIDQDVLSVIGLNKLQNNLQVCVVKTPGFGGSHTEMYLEDLSLLTGAPIIREGTEYNFETYDEKLFGENVNYIKVDSSSTIIETNTSDELICGRIEKIDEEIKSAGNDLVLIDSLKNRKNKFINGLVNIFIASESDVEMFERKDRLDDAIGSIKSALKSGFVSGMGSSYNIAFKYLYENEFNNFEKDFLEAFKTAILAPAIQNYKNCEIPEELYLNILNSQDLKNAIGLDYRTSEEVNLLSNGIIDPSNVVIQALENAFSVASTLFSSSSTILFDKNDESK